MHFINNVKLNSCEAAYDIFWILEGSNGVNFNYSVENKISICKHIRILFLWDKQQYSVKLSESSLFVTWEMDCIFLHKQVSCTCSWQWLNKCMVMLLRLINYE